MLEIAPVEFNRLLSIFKLSNGANDILSSGILISLYYIEQKEIFKLQERLESISVNLNSKVDLKELKEYTEVVKFLKDLLLLCSNEVNLQKKYMGGKRQVIEKA